MASSDAQLPDSPFPFPVMFTLSLPARSVVINPFAQTMLVIPGVDIIPDDDAKRGLPPASKDSIKALETVVIGENSEGGEVVGDHCVVCLEEWGAGDVATVMPCKHRFHGDCIEKWLGVHGSCPVCRYELPPEVVDGDGKKAEEDGHGRGSRVLVFSINFGGIFGDTGADSGDSHEGSNDASRRAADSSAATASEQE